MVGNARLACGEIGHWMSRMARAGGGKRENGGCAKVISLTETRMVAAMRGPAASGRVI